MIGRDEQLQEVIHHIESVIKSTIQENVLFVTGEAGIGKSTFLKAVAEEAASLLSAPIVSMAECSTPLAGQNIGEAEALKPWVDAIDSLVRQSAESFKNQKKSKFDIGKFLLDTAPAWIELIPVLGTTVSAGMEIIGAGFDQLYMNKKLEKNTTAMSQQQIFQQYINLLLKISETTPLVIILDDFHWADDSSCNLLFSVARQLLKSPVLIIVAYRPDDVLTSRDGGQHAILHIKNELERYELGREITIPRLTANNLDTIMRQRFKNYVNNDEFEEWLAHTAGGNALFITQFLKTLEEDGFLKPDTGEFTGDYATVKVPKTAYAVISERIRRLTADSRELLQYASVEGETFTAAILSKISEMPQLKTLQKLRMVEEIHQIIASLGKQPVYSQETSAFKFNHSILHRALYESLGPEERELLHEAVLSVLKEEWTEILLKNQNVRSVAGRIAVHAIVSKDYVFAAEVLLENARASWAEGAASEALQQITKGLNELEKITKQNESSELLKANLLLLQAEIVYFEARYPKAIELYMIAKEIFLRYHVAKKALAADLGLVYTYRMQSRFEAAMELVLEILTKTADEQFNYERTIALYQLGRCLTELNMPEKGIEKMNGSYDLAVQSHDHENIILALNGLGTAFELLQDFEKALEYYNKGLAVVEESGESEMKAVFLGNIGNIYHYREDFENALRFYHDALQLHRKAGGLGRQVVALENSAVVYRRTRQFETSIQYLSEAIAICETADDQFGKAYALFLLAKTYLESGDSAMAKRTAGTAHDLAKEIHDEFTRPRAEALLKNIETQTAEQR